MNSVYIVIDNYRPTDIDVTVFATEQAAIVYARTEARERAHRAGKQLATEGSGWFQYGLRVVARDVREG